MTEVRGFSSDLLKGAQDKITADLRSIGKFGELSGFSKIQPSKC